MRLSDALDLGVNAHKNKDFREADKYYTAILKAHPNHPETNHNMGILAFELGHVEKSLPYFQAAAQINPHVIQFWISVIKALIRLGRFKDAQDSIDKACEYIGSVDQFTELKILIDKSMKSQEQQRPPENEVTKLIGLYNKKKFEETLTNSRALCAKYPQSIELLNIYGATFAALQKHGSAINIFKKIIEINPRVAELYHNLGNSYKEIGDQKAAIENYEKAISINSNYAEAYNNIGIIHKDTGDLDSAIAVYKKALVANGNYAEVHYNLGNAYKEQEKLDKAIECYQKALTIQPGLFEAFLNLGITYMKKLSFPKALQCFKYCIRLNNDHVTSKILFTECFQKVDFSSSDSEILAVIEGLLIADNLVRPRDIAKPIIKLLCTDQALQRLLGKNEFSFEDLMLFFEFLNKNPVLRKLMTLCPLPDIPLEQLLTKVREQVLLNIYNLEPNTVTLDCCSALALQCYANEFIYTSKSKEYRLLKRLKKRIKQSVENGIQPGQLLILCLAQYEPLDRFKWSKSILISQENKEVLHRQLIEPQEIRQFSQNVKQFNAIADTISLVVKNQYEENPYPRWIKTRFENSPKDLREIFAHSRFKVQNIDKINSLNPEILIAGCGTGLQAINAANTYKSAKILAVDLSNSSLSYALKRTCELDIKNIHYLQADILNLKKLNRNFDIIECIGVLHHMHDPRLGLDGLCKSLHTNGLLKLGLYSKVARNEIISLKSEISQRSISWNPQKVRQFRKEIISRKPSLENINDFYSMSEFRDLLFHEQEHLFTIECIINLLNEYNLNFCGFLNSTALEIFRFEFGHTKDIFDLRNWIAFEEKYPTTFLGMYQFWCQKI